MLKKFSDELIIEAIKQSLTIKDALQFANMATSGGNFQTVKRIIKKYNIDTSHFNKPGFRKGHSPKNKLTNGKMFVENSIYCRSKLKKRILDENIIPYICSRCGINEWQGEELSLHLDHINGIRNDNRLENLRFLCPNCHSLTETYCGKANKVLPKPPKKCECGKEINHRSNFCVECAKTHRNR